MVAGFLAGYLAKGDYAEAFKMGLCTGKCKRIFRPVGNERRSGAGTTFTYI